MMIVALMTYLASKTNATVDTLILETSSFLQSMILSNYCKWDEPSHKQRHFSASSIFMKRGIGISTGTVCREMSTEVFARTVKKSFKNLLEVREPKRVNKSQRQVIYKLSTWRLNVMKMYNF